MENSREEIIRRMATYGKEVEVFQADECVAHFYVGTDTQDQLGTYMLKKGAALPSQCTYPDSMATCPPASLAWRSSGTTGR